MNNLYSQNILDHYRYPRNFGHLKNFHRKNEEGNPLCGDKLGVELKLSASGKKIKSEKIADIRFYGEGCAISIASASMLSEKAKGQSVESIMKLAGKDILALLRVKLSPSRIKCAMLSLEILQKALK